MFLTFCTLAGLVACAARGAVRVRRAGRRSDPGDEPATMLPRHLGRLHYDLLRCRTELRSALGMPVGRCLDLRPGSAEPLTGPQSGADAIAAAAARARLARLWRQNSHLLGEPQRQLWHVHGRLDWVRVGPVGRQVLTLRATLAHDPGRWIAVRASRRSRSIVPGLGGGGSRVRGTVAATDPTDLLASLGRAVADRGPRPALTDAAAPARRTDRGGAPVAPHGARLARPPRGRRGPSGPARLVHRLRRLRALASPGWDVERLEVVAASTPLPRSLPLAPAAMGRPAP